VLPRRLAPWTALTLVPRYPVPAPIIFDSADERAGFGD
jgi:hypothetical protein